MNINPWICFQRQYVKGIDQPQQQIQQNGIDLRIGTDIILPHGQCKNIDFIETIHCWENCFALPVATRSSFSRKGIFCTSGLWDTGYNGPGGCTIYNMSGSEISIAYKTRICQIVFFPAPTNTNKYSGYYNQTTDINSKL
jgi:deoxycytidine triphosphate deaminase